MSLHKYTQTRLVVLRPDASAYDALRAMEDNHIGAVLVQEDAELVGIVTDRDLALSVTTSELDPFLTPLADVMSMPVAILPVTANEREAARLMRERGVRRIPIVDGGRPVGIVTLDDLLVAEALEVPAIAALVRAQLAQPARFKPLGAIRPQRAHHPEARANAAQRHAARTKAAYGGLIRSTLEATGLESTAQAEAALEEVLTGLTHRVQMNEARQLLAQLPILLRERLAPRLGAPDRGVTREAIERRVAERLQLELARAREVVRGVGAALVLRLGGGEIADVRSQLPEDLKSILSTADAHAWIP